MMQTSRSPIIKATVIEERSTPQLSAQACEDGTALAGVLEPPYDPEQLLQLAEHSNSLRQCVDANKTNIDSFGHRFEAAIDLEDEEGSDEKVRDCILLERRHDASNDDAGPEPSDAEVQERRAELKRQAAGPQPDQPSARHKLGSSTPVGSWARPERG